MKIDKLTCTGGIPICTRGKRRSVRKQLTVNRVQLKWTCFELMSYIVNTLTMATLISPSNLVYLLDIHVAATFE